jgi:hypothetical protein
MDVVQNYAILAPNSGTESEILSRHTYQFAGIWQFYKYGWLMRISEIFLLEYLGINVPYHRHGTCPNGQVGQKVNVEPCSSLIYNYLPVVQILFMARCTRYNIIKFVCD